MQTLGLPPDLRRSFLDPHRNMYMEPRYPPPFHLGRPRTREVCRALAWGIASRSCRLFVPHRLLMVLSQILWAGPVSPLLPVHPLRHS